MGRLRGVRLLFSIHLQLVRGKVKSYTYREWSKVSFQIASSVAIIVSFQNTLLLPCLWGGEPHFSQVVKVGKSHLLRMGMILPFVGVARSALKTGQSTFAILKHESQRAPFCAGIGGADARQGDGTILLSPPFFESSVLRNHSRINAEAHSAPRLPAGELLRVKVAFALVVGGKPQNRSIWAIWTVPIIENRFRHGCELRKCAIARNTNKPGG